MQNKIILGLQMVAGLLLVVFGLNGFFHFIPMPQPSPEMGAWLGAIFKIGYLFPLIALIEIVAGLSYLSNKFSALMAVILMPVMLNALLAHIFLNDIGGSSSAFFIVCVTLLVLYKNREKYSELFKA